MLGDPLSVSATWNAYGVFRDPSEVMFSVEADECERLLGDFASSDEFTPGHWTDANPAVFAGSAGHRLFSIDRDFARLSGLEFLHLRA